MKYLITGLGNIGDKYHNTRHNIGFVVLDALANEHDAKFSHERHAFMTKIKFKGRIFVLIKPTTFMNLSGKAIKYWLNKENISIENLLVVADDIALPTGVLRLRKKGGDGGHNGLIHIIQSLNTSNFARLRIGVGNDFPKGYQADYVLGEWTNQEADLINPKIETACKMIKSFGTIGVDRTMNSFNKK